MADPTRRDGPLAAGAERPAGIGRLLTALITPCDPVSGAVDLDAVDALVAYQAAGGADGLFILGTAGQGPLLTIEERASVLRAVLAAARSRGEDTARARDAGPGAGGRGDGGGAGGLTVVCHVAGATTADSLRLLDDAVAAGATAVAAVPPVYYSPDRRTVDAYYRDLLDRSPLPLYAYDNPLATGYAFTVDQLAGLVGEGLAGAKVARADLLFIQRLVAAGVPTWTANADLNLAGYGAGASGAISTVTNLAPGLFRRLRDAFDRADHAAARDLQARVSALAAAVRVPIIGALHHGAARLGLPAGAPRRPLRLPGPEERAVIDRALAELDEIVDLDEPDEPSASSRATSGAGRS